MNIQTRIAEILAAEAAAITAVRVTPAFEHAVQAMRDSTGKVLTTGMGKAGHVARKFASTLCSTSTPASYVHPGEAAHGDLGLIGQDDCIVVFSTSGKTREVLEMLELGRDLGLKTVIGITSHPDSSLRSLSNIVLDMGIQTEPCPHRLTPSSSTTVMLAISDALAVLDLFAEDSWRSVYAGELEVRPPGAPTAAGAATVVLGGQRRAPRRLRVPKTCRNGRQDCWDFGTADPPIHVSRRRVITGRAS